MYFLLIFNSMRMGPAEGVGVVVYVFFIFLVPAVGVVVHSGCSESIC